ncbi:MAG: GNAT family N-acetyltransferase [Proteobacteria bacterium]|nr:GNAT family N-acetyltransferase [Pseudomonadota bacterium]
MTLSDQFIEIGERIVKTGIHLKDALSVIDMTFEDQMNRLEDSSPYEAFTGLNKLIDRTVRGTKIEHFRPREACRHFHTIEIHTEEGEILGYLNMLYLKRFVPCYYLVYVEVMPSFRGLGLGNMILNAFMEFLNDRNAVGLLDNIVPHGESTYEIYTRLGWKDLADFIGNGVPDEWRNFMVFIPDSVQSQNLKDRLIRTLFNLKKRKPVIDMHDNEDMVKRTIEEFRSVYRTLTQLFNDELLSGASNPLMHFMFTRLTTKLIGFHRRISTLIGYTGGESLEQISFSDRIRELPVQPYSPWNLDEEDAGIWGDEGMLRSLPGSLKGEPTSFIEGLPFYKRPYLHNCLKNRETRTLQPLKISDLLSFGFDPTRLKEFHHEGVDYIFERISPLFFSALVKQRTFLKKVEKSVSGLRIRGAIVRVNPILLIFRDRGNIYVLRKKVDGVHSQEALDQIKTVPYLQEMNRGIGIDRAMISTISDIRDLLKKKFHSGFKQEIEDLTYFVPWDIENNIPRIHVHVSEITLGIIWIA